MKQGTDRKEYKRGWSTCLPDGALHLITAVCPVFLLHPFLTSSLHDLTLCSMWVSAARTAYQLRGAGVSEASGGLSTCDLSRTTVHSPYAWCQVCVWGKQLYHLQNGYAWGVHLSFNSKLQARVTGT